jgi:hypothetical protein
MIEDSTGNTVRMDVESKFEEYAKFVRDVLRPDYRTCQHAEQEIREEIAEYNDLTKRITDELCRNNNDIVEGRLVMGVD